MCSSIASFQHRIIPPAYLENQRNVCVARWRYLDWSGRYSKPPLFQRNACSRALAASCWRRAALPVALVTGYMLLWSHSLSGLGFLGKVGTLSNNPSNSSKTEQTESGPHWEAPRQSRFVFCRRGCRCDVLFRANVSILFKYRHKSRLAACRDFVCVFLIPRGKDPLLQWAFELKSFDVHCKIVWIYYYELNFQKIVHLLKYHVYSVVRSKRFTNEFRKWYWQRWSPLHLCNVSAEWRMRKVMAAKCLEQVTNVYMAEKFRRVFRAQLIGLIGRKTLAGFFLYLALQIQFQSACLVGFPTFSTPKTLANRVFSSRTPTATGCFMA